MAETHSAAVDQLAADDLISFLKAIPDGRYRRGVRFPQWFLLLVAVLGILSGLRQLPWSGGLCPAASGAAEPGAGPRY
jgi:hypothetical protein